ncbi:MAG: nucleotide exchange factor GrpE [Gloeotrichia echinulata DVL01]
MRNDKSATPSHLKKHWLLYGITATILIISLVGLALAVLPNTQVKIKHDILFVISAIYFLVSCSFFLWIYLRNQAQEFVGFWPKAIDELKRVGRAYFTNTAAIEENSEQVKKLHNDIEQEIRGLVESNNSIAKELMELRQEKGNFKRDLEIWNNSAIDFFQTLEQGLEKEENNERRNVMEKNLQEFEMIVNKRGFYRIIPSLNDKNDESEHEFKDYEQSSNVEPGSILKCACWGYRSGGKVLQRAKVILAKKPENSTDSEQVTPLEASITT